jgi:hypothetical protein
MESHLLESLVQLHADATAPLQGRYFATGKDVFLTDVQTKLSQKHRDAGLSAKIRLLNRMRHTVDENASFRSFVLAGKGQARRQEKQTAEQ